MGGRSVSAGHLGFSFQERIARETNGTVVWLRTTGESVAKQLMSSGERPVDVVFLDGDHSYEASCADWDSWRGRLAPGGLVALHDSRSTPQRPIDHAGSVRFTQEVIRADPQFVVVDEVDSLTVLRRREE